MSEYVLHPNFQRSNSWRKYTNERSYELKDQQSTYHRNFLDEREPIDERKCDASNSLIGFCNDQKEGRDWQVIEINNIMTLLDSPPENVKFFRITIDKEIIIESVKDNGLIRIPYDVFMQMTSCSCDTAKYILLEKSSELNWRMKYLVGIARVLELAPRFEKSRIKVAFLSLSKTEIDLSRCRDLTLTGLTEVLKKSYVDLLKVKKLDPLLPDVKPWSSSSRVHQPEFSRSMSYEEEGSVKRAGPRRFSADIYQTIDSINELVGPKNKNFPLTKRTDDKLRNSNEEVSVIDLTREEDSFNEDSFDEEICRKILPPLPLRCLFKPDRSFNTETWQSIETDNLTLMENVTDKRLFVCDFELKDIFTSLNNGGLLPISKTLHTEIPGLDSKNSTYLVIRKKDGGQFHAVIGIAKVCSKIKNFIGVQVEFLCLSRAEYVLSPWCDVIAFADGQEITCKDDTDLMIAMYKMSFRHKKISPVFTHVFPWSGVPPPRSNPSQRNDVTTPAKINVNGPSVINVNQEGSVNDRHGITRTGNENVIATTKNCQDNNQIENKNRNEEANSERLSPNKGGARFQYAPVDLKNAKGVRGIENDNRIVEDKTQTKETRYENSTTAEVRNSTVGEGRNSTIKNGKNSTIAEGKRSTIEGDKNDVANTVCAKSSEVRDWADICDDDDKFSTVSSNGGTEKLENLVNLCLTDEKVTTNVKENKTVNITKTSTVTSSPSKVAQVKPDKSKFPPLQGLFVNNTKVLANETWQEIERNNLAYVAQSGNIEIYLCNTDIPSIQKSLREHYLTVSRRNMENIATGRARKILILRSQLPQSNTNKLSVVGIATVNTAATIENETGNGRFSVKISYVCLSIPTFPGSYIAPTLSDGAEVISQISSGFLQQYMLALRLKKIQPLFPSVYPWSGRLPEKYASSVAKTKKTDAPKLTFPSSDSSITSTIDRNLKSYSDDIFADAKDLYDECTTSFDQIGSEMAHCTDQKKSSQLPTSPLKTFTNERERYEIEMRAYSDDIERVLTSSGSSPEKSPRNMSPQKSPRSFFSTQQQNPKYAGGFFNTNPTNPTNLTKPAEVKRVGRGRGRGRGMLFIQNNKPGLNVK